MADDFEYFSVVFRGKTTQDLDRVHKVLTPFLKDSEPLFDNDKDRPLAIMAWCHRNLDGWNSYAEYLVECISSGRHLEQTEILSYDGFCALGYPTDQAEQREREKEAEDRRKLDEAEQERLESELDSLQDQIDDAEDDDALKWKIPELKAALKVGQTTFETRDEELRCAEDKAEEHYLERPFRDRRRR